LDTLFPLNENAPNATLPLDERQGGATLKKLRTRENGMRLLTNRADSNFLLFKDAVVDQEPALF
jgi:hypothetical protein